jgi:pyruvate/2-oxoacid:ferredoxin oxidoreductase beta subunit
MKAMPMAEREAYVARATSGKAQWQIENIRRTLEHLGLLLPVGAAAASSRD